MRVGPYASGSVVTDDASSGRFVLPQMTNPAARNRSTSQVSSGSVQPASFSTRIPWWYGSPAECRDRVLQQERHATERAVRESRVGSRGARLVGEVDDDGVQAFVLSVDARERGVEQLARGRLAVTDQLRLRGRVEPSEVVVH